MDPKFSQSDSHKNTKYTEQVQSKNIIHTREFKKNKVAYVLMPRTWFWLTCIHGS